MYMFMKGKLLSVAYSKNADMEGEVLQLVLQSILYIHENWNHQLLDLQVVCPSSLASVPEYLITTSQ